MTPLHRAAEQGRSVVVEALLAKGAKEDAKDNVRSRQKTAQPQSHEPGSAAQCKTDVRAWNGSSSVQRARARIRWRSNERTGLWLRLIAEVGYFQSGCLCGSLVVLT
jgi:hypothetical protein